MISFNRTDFFPYKDTLNISELSQILSDLLIDQKFDNDYIIKNISSLDTFYDDSIIFTDQLLNIKSIKKNLSIITNNKSNFELDVNNVFLVKDISKSYNLLVNKLYLHEDNISYSDSYDFKNGSYISKYSHIDDSVSFGKNCVIERGVKIGKNSIIKNNVNIKCSLIGSNVVIGDNTSIGTTGFGFEFKTRGSSNLNPQIGIVYIDDNCHIGSTCTIDRGKIDTTFIGKNCMIDNLVHIAHNVVLLDNACIAAQTGISGSVKIGTNVTIGGQVGFAGHINIGNNVVIAAKSGVTKNIKDNSIVAGFPAIDINLWKKKIIIERKNGYK